MNLGIYRPLPAPDEPPTDAGGWMRLLVNLHGSDGPRARVLRDLAVRKLRAAGWHVRPVRRPEGQERAS